MDNQTTTIPIRPAPTLTGPQDTAVETIERVMSCFSILGCLFVITSFLLVDNLKAKTFNRLLFYASWGNLMSNVATIIGTAGVRAGLDSSTCRAQATLIQWFLPADCLWTFCMALNVFLTFQTRTLSVNLRKMEKWYFLFCYGIPAIPALTYLFMDVTQGTSYYGNATLWCWISKKHDALRLSTFYGPVWLMILVTMALYAITGRHIYKGQVRNKLMQNALSNDFRRNGSVSSSTVSSEQPPLRKINLTSKTPLAQITGMSRRDSFEISNEFLAICANNRPVTAGDNDESKPRSVPIVVPAFGDGIRYSEEAVPATSSPPRAHIVFDEYNERNASNNSNIKVTTTITSSSIPAPNQAFQFRHCQTGFPQQQPTQPPLQLVQAKINRGAKTYAQVAFLLYLVMLAVWVPSTVNRVWGYIEPKRINFPLVVAAALVLPLQGFFNTLIYLFTSRAEIKRIYRKHFIKKSAQLDLSSPQISEFDRPSVRNNKSPETVITFSAFDDNDEDKESFKFPWHGEKEFARKDTYTV